MTVPQIGASTHPGGAVFNVAAYGAVGDALPLAGISAAAGSNTITVAYDQLLSPSDVGKVILIPLAAGYDWSHTKGGSSNGTGTTGADEKTGSGSPPATVLTATLATTITAVAGTTVTLADPLVNGVTDVTAVYGTDTSESIGEALKAARRAGGGTVFIPAGTYLINQRTLSLASHVSLQGEGTRSLLVLGKANPAVQISGEAYCTVSDLAIDLFNTENFPSAVYVGTGAHKPHRWSEDIRVERCSLYNSLVSYCKGTETLHGVVLAGCRRVWITDNFTEGVELKCALPPGVSAVQVTGNTIVNPMQYGVSFATTRGAVTDCVAANNVFQDVSQQGAIYAGDDGGGDANVVCDRLTIAGNVISGVPSKLGFFIQLRIPPRAHDWIVKDNVIRVVGGSTCGVNGIYVAPRQAPEAVLDNLVISGNVVAGTDQPGIYLDAARGDHGAAKSKLCVPGPPTRNTQPRVRGFLIHGNLLENTGGIGVVNQYTPHTAYRNGRIAGNVVIGGSIALLNGGPVDICDNLIDTATAPVDVSTAEDFGTSSVVVVTGAAMVLGAAGAGSSVTSMVHNNRILNSTGDPGLVNGIREAGDPGATFDVVYSGNAISDNTGAPILTMGSSNGPPAVLQGVVVSTAEAPAAAAPAPSPALSPQP